MKFKKKKYALTSDLTVVKRGYMQIYFILHPLNKIVKGVANCKICLIEKMHFSLKKYVYLS